MSAAGHPAQTCARCGATIPPDARVCGECGELLRATASGALRDPPPVYATTDLQVGDIVEGKWRLEEIVGRGGMGAVFAATEVTLGRKVAVKALSANLAAEEFVSRFEREARVLGILHHPNIVTLHWVGRHNGVPFIVMNYLEGDPLRKWVDEQGGRVSVDGLLQIARPMCSALSYVHSKGVIHRDLKPSNIIVAPNGHVTVFDLGIARPHDSQLTKTGIIFGTPGYMSPELIVGEKNLDGRLDLYALAVILFEIVTGQSPFSERHEDSLLRAHLMKPRPDASQLRPDLPPELGKVLQKALAIDPKDRYPDCDEFLVALEAACGKREFHEAATIMRVPLSRDALAKAPPPPGMERPEPAPNLTPVRPAPVAPPPANDSTRIERGVPPPESDSTRIERGSRGSASRPAPRSDAREPARASPEPAPQAKASSARAARPQTRSATPGPAPRKTGEARQPPPPKKVEEEEAFDADAIRPRRTGLKLLLSVALIAIVAAAAFTIGRRGAGPDTPEPKPTRDESPVAIHATGGQTGTATIKKTTTTFAAAQKNYGELQIDVTLEGSPVPATVAIDGEEVGQAPLAIPAKAGSHRLRITHEGAAEATVKAQLTSGTSLHYEVELAPAK